jgi:hypothetical protein
MAQSENLFTSREFQYELLKFELRISERLLTHFGKRFVKWTVYNS